MWLGPVFLGPEPDYRTLGLYGGWFRSLSLCGCEQTIVELTRLNYTRVCVKMKLNYTRVCVKIELNYTRVCVQMKLEAVSFAACDATNNALVGLENAGNNCYI